MTLSVKTAELQSTTMQAAVPRTTHQVVVDVGVTDGGDKHQPIGVKNPQLLHLSLVLLQGLHHLSGQLHRSLLTHLGGSQDMQT